MSYVRVRRAPPSARQCAEDLLAVGIKRANAQGGFILGLRLAALRPPGDPRQAVDAIPGKTGVWPSLPTTAFRYFERDYGVILSRSGRVVRQTRSEASSERNVASLISRDPGEGGRRPSSQREQSLTPAS